MRHIIADISQLKLYWLLTTNLNSIRLHWHAIKITNNLHASSLAWDSKYLFASNGCEIAVYTTLVQLRIPLHIKVHYMNLSDLIMRAIIRAIIVFTTVFTVVVLRKCQQLDKCFGFYTYGLLYCCYCICEGLQKNIRSKAGTSIGKWSRKRYYFLY